MSLIFMDSPDSNEGATKWTIFQFGTGAATPDGRASYRNTSSSGGTRTVFTAVQSVMASFLGLVSDLGDSAQNSQLLMVGSNGLNQIFLQNTSDGRVQIRLGSDTGTIIAQSAAGVLAADAWFHYEIRVVVHDTAGVVQVWIDGSQVIDFSGDTNFNGVNDQADQVTFGRTAGALWDVADIAIRDDTTPIGPTKVVPLKPNGPGTHTNLTPTGAATNWEAVDEDTPDDDTSYVASATQGDIDTYTLDDLPQGVWTVHAIQTSLYARASDAGARFVRPVLRTGGADHVGTSQSVGIDYDSKLEVFDLNPGTAAAWTEAEIDALEAGIEIRDS